MSIFKKNENPDLSVRELVYGTLVCTFPGASCYTEDGTKVRVMLRSMEKSKLKEKYPRIYSALKGKIFETNGSRIIIAVVSEKAYKGLSWPGTREALQSTMICKLVRSHIAIGLDASDMREYIEYFCDNLNDDQRKKYSAHISRLQKIFGVGCNQIPTLNSADLEKAVQYITAIIRGTKPKDVRYYEDHVDAKSDGSIDKSFRADKRASRKAAKAFKDGGVQKVSDDTDEIEDPDDDVSFENDQTELEKPVKEVSEKKDKKKDKKHKKIQINDRIKSITIYRMPSGDVIVEKDNYGDIIATRPSNEQAYTEYLAYSASKNIKIVEVSKDDLDIKEEPVSNVPEATVENVPSVEQEEEKVEVEVMETPEVKEPTPAESVQTIPTKFPTVEVRKNGTMELPKEIPDCVTGFLNQVNYTNLYNAVNNVLIGRKKSLAKNQQALYNKVVWYIREATKTEIKNYQNAANIVA